MITKDDIATYRANYNLDDFGVAGSLGFPTKGACAAINALCDAYEEIEKQRDELLVALEETRRELDACQKVIWLASDYGFDPAYVNGAKAAIKVADAALSSVKGQQ